MSTFLLLLVSTLSTSSQASFPFDSLLFFSPFSLHCMIPLCSPSCLLIVYIIEPLPFSTSTLPRTNSRDIRRDEGIAMSLVP